MVEGAWISIWEEVLLQGKRQRDNGSVIFI